MLARRSPVEILTIVATGCLRASERGSRGPLAAVRELGEELPGACAVLNARSFDVIAMIQGERVAVSIPRRGVEATLDPFFCQLCGTTAEDDCSCAYASAA